MFVSQPTPRVVWSPGRPLAPIIGQADRFDPLRCLCPACLLLDARDPGAGFQLEMFPDKAARPVHERSYEAGRVIV